MIVVKPSSPGELDELLTAAAVRGVHRRGRPLMPALHRQHAPTSSARCWRRSARARSRTCSSRSRPRRGWRGRSALPPALAETDLVRHMRALAARNARRRRCTCFLGARRLRSLHAEPDQPPDPARRVLHGLHAVPARGQPGHAADDLRVPDDDRRADRHGRRQRVDLRRRLVAGRGGADGACASRARTEIVLGRAACNPLYRRVVATYCEGPGLRLRDVPRARRRDRPRRRAAAGGREDGGAGRPVAELLRLPRGRGGRRPRSPTRPARCWWSSPIR